MMGTYIHWVLLFAWVLLFRKLTATGLIGTYIYRVLVIDGYLYSRVYGIDTHGECPAYFSPRQQYRDCVVDSGHSQCENGM